MSAGTHHTLFNRYFCFNYREWEVFKDIRVWNIKNKEDLRYIQIKMNTSGSCESSCRTSKPKGTASVNILLRLLISYMIFSRDKITYIGLFVRVHIDVS